MIRIIIFLLGISLFQSTWAECFTDANGNRVCDSYMSDPAASDSSLISPNFTISLSDLDPVNADSGDIPAGSSAVTALLNKIATFLLFLIPMIAAVSLVIAGYFYILSGGDSEKASRAKTIIKWNAIAIVLALSSYAIIAIIASILDANI